jgi:hypothetical protein
MLAAATVGASAATARQYMLRIKSLLSYGHDLVERVRRIN